MRQILCVLGVGALLLGVATPSQAWELPGPNVGVNLAGVNYYSNELPWLDRFKGSMAFMSQELGQSWGVGVPLTLRPDGYPAFLPDNHVAQSLWDQPRGYPAEQVVILYDGAGTLNVKLGASVVSNTPGRVVANILPGSSRTLVMITATDPADPVTNIRMVPLVNEASYTAGEPAYPWDPTFIRNWGMMAGYRFMDWGETNNSTVSQWSQRTTADYQTQAGKAGVALEYQVQLANQTGKDPWVCIPHLADDNYIRRAAVLIRDTLEPGLAVRVEYSNEVWNSQFQQATYAKQQGLALGLSTNEFQAQLRYYSQRSVEIFEIFAEVFTHDGADPAGMDRLVRVMSAQAANTWTSEQVLGWNNAHEKTDVLAIAPYFGSTVTTTALATEVKEMTWEERIDWAWSRHAVSLQYMQNQAAKADQYGVRLFAYEAGQHFVGGGGRENDDELTAILQELNRRPEMREMYLAYLQGWQAAGGEDIMMFSSASGFSKWGSWGTLEYQNQPWDDAPKMQGILDFLARLGDLDASGNHNAADLDIMLAALATGSADPRYDLNDDGTIDLADMDRLLGLLGTLHGDANLDGRVDTDDLGMLLGRWGTAGQSWAHGDFNGDQTVNTDDLGMLLANWGVQASAIPEPTSLALLLAGAFVLRRR